ncbi:MAG: glucose-6-phosphate isomerase [Candidatus Omnitrophica bacterium]|nr:glucose-6-phosphate isomerase [Candidatus Omnitrophota bacterium]
MSSTQTLSLGRATDAVTRVCAQLADQHFIQRLWARDPSLWSVDATVQGTIRRRLGWLTIARVMAPHCPALQALPRELRQAGLTHTLLLGMGGSGLFAEVCRNTFGVAADHLELTVLDSTDPAAIRAAQQRCPSRQLSAIISSKSGSTSEISALSTYFYDVFQAADGQPGAHCLAITDTGTSLEAQAAAWKCRRVFVHGPDTGLEVGGRFSALTYFGLVPAALIGVDTAQLVQRAEEMFRRCGAEAPLAENPGAMLGITLAVLAASGRDKMTLLCAPALASFGTWVEQLIAESIGKQGKGIVPIHGEPPREPKSYGADRVFVELQLAAHSDAKIAALTDALSAAGHPVIRIQWQDRYDLGGEVAKWEIATAVAGGVLQINPFDEPNVKESKDRTKALLEQYTRTKTLSVTDTPQLADADVTIYGAAGASKMASLTQGLTGFLGQVRAVDYVAILSFLPRTPALDGALHALRQQLSRRFTQATMLQFGPRYLHSTGQLFKGGADTGLFLLFTADERQDLPIPGEAFSFGVLKQAQALGDFQAMQQRGRRALRLHLRGNLESALRRILTAVDEALTA